MIDDKPCWCGGKAKWSDDLDQWVCVESEFHDPFSTGVPEKVTRLYVAGPMTGYADCNYPMFNQVSEDLRRVGYETVNPAEVHLERCHYLDLIREDLRVMLDCHGIAVLDKWWESAGARNEVSVGGFLKMPVRSWQEWVALSTTGLRA